MVLLVISLAYQLLSIKTDVLGKGKTVQQKGMKTLEKIVNIVSFCSWMGPGFLRTSLRV